MYAAENETRLMMMMMIQLMLMGKNRLCTERSIKRLKQEKASSDDYN